MASPNIEQIIKNLFSPNTTESISAEDLQLFTSAIFQSAEAIIRKFETPYDVDIFRNSNPEIPMLKGDLCILTDDSIGTYICTLDKPFYTDLKKISEEVSEIEVGDLADVTVASPIEGDVIVYDGTEWSNSRIGYGGISDRPTLPYPGMQYFDAEVGKPIWYNKEIQSWITADGLIV